MAIGVADIEQRQAIDVDAKPAQQRRQCQRVEPAGLDRGDRRPGIERGEGLSGGEFGPVRRAQAGDAAAFLVDQDGHVAAGEVAQAGGEGANLFGIGDIALEQDVAGGVGRSEQRAFIGGDGEPGEAQKAGLHHSITVHGAPAACKLRHNSAASPPLARRR